MVKVKKCTKKKQRKKACDFTSYAEYSYYLSYALERGDEPLFFELNQFFKIVGSDIF